MKAVVQCCDSLFTATPSKTFQNQLPMTPKTRKRKSYIADEITKNITAATTNLTLEDKIEAVQLSLSKLGLLEYTKFLKKKNKKWNKVNSHGNQESCLEFLTIR